MTSTVVFSTNVLEMHFGLALMNMQDSKNQSNLHKKQVSEWVLPVASISKCQPTQPCRKSTTGNVITMAFNHFKAKWLESGAKCSYHTLRGDQRDGMLAVQVQPQVRACILCGCWPALRVRCKIGTKHPRALQVFLCGSPKS